MNKYKQKKAKLFLLIFGIIGTVYSTGYLTLRVRNDFVRDGTYYTESGVAMHTDRIRLGEWRVSKDE